MSKYAALGTLLQSLDGETPATIANVMDINGPELSRDTEDVTTHDSPEGFEEFVSTIKRSGELTFDLVWDPADATHDGTTGLRSMYDDGEYHDFQIVYPTADNDAHQFSGLVTKIGHVSPVGGALKASVAIKISGPVEETVAAS